MSTSYASRLAWRIWCSALLAACGVAAPWLASVVGQTAVKDGIVHGRRAFILENDHMLVSTLPGGGFIGEVRFKSSDPRTSINVMRVPHYQTIDPHTYTIAEHGALYGTGMQRRLMSGYMGHFLAFPHFAGSSPAELNQDYGQHGEAIAVEWKRDRAELRNGGATLTYHADLPKTQYRVERTITLPRDETVAYVEESVENVTVFGRPMQWTQHVTFGPPFVEVNQNFVDVSPATVLGRAGGAGVQPSRWPNGSDAQGNTRDARSFTGAGSTWLLDGSTPLVYFTMYHVDYPVLIGYIFESAPNRWVLDYQENLRVQERPWDGKVIARGFCIGNSVVGGLRNAVERGSQLETPVFGWIDAREKRTQRYALFLAEIPLGFRGVAELNVAGQRITIVERETGRTLFVNAWGL